MLAFLGIAREISFLGILPRGKVPLLPSFSRHFCGVMVSKQQATRIVDEQKFILATRDTGYRSTCAAISELVDNAIQAKATIVRVFIDPHLSLKQTEIGIAVMDNGTGMDRSTLSTAMQFAGSSRFNDRSGLGRFGMGLPNSSVSQSRRVDVFTWQKRDNVLHSYLDVDEISIGKLKTVPIPKPAVLPGWAEKYVRKTTGTLVVWSRCDRLDHRRATTIVDKLLRPLAQKFRYYLWAGNKIYVNNNSLEPFDPLYVRTGSDAKVAREFGDILPFEFRVPNDPNRTSVVQVRFAELPIDAWSGLSVEEKRELGITKGAGVSIVRAGREIDFGWYFMGNKRKENYDDWWRCEVKFEPELDELFGVNHSKQEISPSVLIRAELGQHLEALAYGLNYRARQAFAITKLKSHQHKATAESVADAKESFLTPGKDSRLQAKPQRASKIRLDYRIEFYPLRSPDLYIWELKHNNQVLLTLNSDHPFVEAISSDQASNELLQNAIRSLLIAMVRAELALPSGRKDRVLAEFREAFGNILSCYMDGAQ